MDEATYKILDILSRNLGKPMSINELTRKIEEIYGEAYYANTNEKIHSLTLDNVTKLSKSGRSFMISLNFENYLLIDLLAETELMRKQNFLKKRQEMQILMMKIDALLHRVPSIKSVSLINPERNSKLNKMEIMLHLMSPNQKSTEETKIQVSDIITSLQGMYNIRIDYAILEDEIFLDLLKSNESNPMREMLYNKISVLHPQGFWISIRGEILNGTMIVARENQTHPAKISDEDLIFNLARFGYVEFGSKLEPGRPICMEYIISAIMFHKDTRRMDAIPIILAKNSKKVNYGLLLFLARKYAFEGILLGIFKALRNLAYPRIVNMDEPIRLLESMKTDEIKANAKRMKEKLRLYHVA